MIDLKLYRRGHLDFMELSEVYDGDPAVLECTEANIEHQGLLSETILWNKTPLAVIQASLVWPQVLEVYAVVGTEAKNHPMAFFRTVKARLEYYEKLFQVRRTQSYVRARFSYLSKWMEALGFEREGLMRNFGPEGEDYYLYARVSDGQKS